MHFHTTIAKVELRDHERGMLVRECGQNFILSVQTSTEETKEKKPIVEQKPYLNVTATQFLADEQRSR